MCQVLLCFDIFFINLSLKVSSVLKTKSMHWAGFVSSFSKQLYKIINRKGMKSKREVKMNL